MTWEFCKENKSSLIKVDDSLTTINETGHRKALYPILWFIPPKQNLQLYSKFTVRFKIKIFAIQFK